MQLMTILLTIGMYLFPGVKESGAENSSAGTGLPSSGRQSYTWMCGAFVQPGNADGFAEVLALKGYDVYQVRKSGNRLMLVGVQRFRSKQEAKAWYSGMDSASKKQYTPWLLAYDTISFEVSKWGGAPKENMVPETVPEAPVDQDVQGVVLHLHLADSVRSAKVQLYLKSPEDCAEVAAAFDSLAALAREGKLSLQVLPSGVDSMTSGDAGDLAFPGLVRSAEVQPAGSGDRGRQRQSAEDRGSIPGGRIDPLLFERLTGEGSFAGKIPGFRNVLIFLERSSLGYRLLFLLGAAALFFFLNIAFVVLVVVVTNRVKNQRAERYSRCRSHVIGALSPLLFNLENSGMRERELAVDSLRLLRKKFEQQVIIDVLMEAGRNLTGSSNVVFSELYEKLGLYKVSISATRSVDSFRKAMGIRELAYLSSRSNGSLLSPFLDSRNPNVLQEAILAYILVEKESPLGFIDRLNRPFTRWIQLSAYYTMYFNGIEPPLLRQFLNHHNHQVVLWCLRLVAIYNQVEATREVTRCLTHQDADVQQVAVQVSLVLENWKVKDMLKKRYADEPLRVRLEILKLIRHFADKKDTPFLNSVIGRGTFTEVRESVRILYELDGDSREELHQTISLSPEKLSPFINHVAEPKNRIAI